MTFAPVDVAIERRACDVVRLYAESPAAEIITPAGQPQAAPA